MKAKEKKKNKPTPTQKKVKAWVYLNEMIYNEKEFICTRNPDEYGQKIEVLITYTIPN